MQFYDGANIEAVGEGLYSAVTDAVYWNTVGPFGGWISAVFLRCLALETNGAGDPLTMSVQFAGPMQQGAFRVRVKAIRANRSTTFWSAELVQSQSGVDASCAFATVVIAVRRESPEFIEKAAPQIAPPEDLRRFTPPLTASFLKRLDMRFVSDGPLPKLYDGEMFTWARALDSAAMDYETLSAICDCGLPQIFVRLRRPVPVSSVTMNVFFHAKRDELAAVGEDFLLTGTRMRAAVHGFFDASTAIWTRGGALVATTEQIVWFKVPE